MSALLNVNGDAIVYGRIRMPRVGLWDATLRVDATQALAGTATISTPDGSFSLQGTVIRQGIFDGILKVRMIAGAAGLATPIPAKSYQSVSVQLLLTDILSNAKNATTGLAETLSPTSDASILTAQKTRWVRPADTAGIALYRLLQTLPTSFRVLPDGSFWIGTDTYPTVSAPEFSVIQRRFGEGLAELESQQPFLLPGSKLMLPNVSVAQKVSAVIHMVDRDRYRANTYFES